MTFKKTFFQKLAFFLLAFFLFIPEVFAFPIYAQQAYENPREANGRIVCANCHLAQKPTEIESPTSILPNTVFESIVKIPYDKKQKQIIGNGQRAGLNVGALMILPEGFKLAPKDRLNDELKAKIKSLYITPYSPSKENILVVGPISGDKYDEIGFPILSPDPEKNKNTFYVKYPIYVGANRGRGQIYPTGEKTNNNPILAKYSGKINNIEKGQKEYTVNILTKENKLENQTFSLSYDLSIKENDLINIDDTLTQNPNVGGFGQAESEIVLQNPARIYGYLAFCIITVITQSIFVFKKKQFEKVQLAEMDF
jgi:apocytochrome f